MEFGFFITWLALSIIAGVIASNKGRSGIGFFLLGVILSPLVGIIAALIVAENVDVTEKQKLDTGTGKKCPYCAEIIKPEAKICRYCGKDFPKIEVEEILKPMKYFGITSGREPSELDKLDKSGNTPLMIASAKGNYDEVVYLLNNGANPLIKDKNGMTAKIRAYNRSNFEIVKLLEKSESIYGTSI